MAMWAPLWCKTNQLDGHVEYLCLWHPHLRLGFPTIFRTRLECREFIQKEYSYIKHRPDLRREPHCWRMPKPVKIDITY